MLMPSCSTSVELTTNVKSLQMEVCGLAAFKEISFTTTKPNSYFNASGKVHFVKCTQPLYVCVCMFILPGAKIKNKEKSWFILEIIETHNY